jgi:hypothetical protein
MPAAPVVSQTAHNAVWPPVPSAPAASAQYSRSAPPAVALPYSADPALDDDDPFAIEKAGLSDTWVWVLACIPIIGWILEIIVFVAIGPSEWFGFFIFFALNTTFILLDKSELEKRGYIFDGVFWLGLALVPVYMFVRAARTNRNYAYAIVWCVLFVVYVGASVIGSVNYHLVDTRHQGGSSHTITCAQYDRIRDNMTYEQVQGIMGSSGELISDSAAFGIVSRTYSWGSIWSGKIIWVSFVNGRVNSKSQQGVCF